MMWREELLPPGTAPRIAQEQDQAEVDAVFSSLAGYEKATADCYRAAHTTPAGSSRGWPYDR
jgi:hypothetical protein